MGRIPAADADYVTFFEEAEPRLRRALVALRGPADGVDATAEALAWAWQNWERVAGMANPVGYLFRVGQSRSRTRRQGLLPARVGAGDAYVEPALTPALAELTDTQRTVVVLVHGCDWTYTEVAEALGISKSSVGTHLSRGMARLRRRLNVELDDG